MNTEFTEEEMIVTYTHINNTHPPRRDTIFRVRLENKKVLRIQAQSYIADEEQSGKIHQKQKNVRPE